MGSGMMLKKALYCPSEAMVNPTDVAHIDLRNWALIVVGSGPSKVLMPRSGH
jgi:hypothetical protein